MLSQLTPIFFCMVRYLLTIKQFKFYEINYYLQKKEGHLIFFPPLFLLDTGSEILDEKKTESRISIPDPQHCF
jgi:hypothetical protein